MPDFIVNIKRVTLLKNPVNWINVVTAFDLNLWHDKFVIQVFIDKVMQTNLSMVSLKDIMSQIPCNSKIAPFLVTCVIIP